MIWIRTVRWGQLKFQGLGKTLPRSRVLHPTVPRKVSTVLSEITKGEEWGFTQPDPQIHVFNISYMDGDNVSYFGFFCRDRGGWRQANGLHRRAAVSDHDCWKSNFRRPDSCPHCHVQALPVWTASGQGDHAPGMPVHLLHIGKFFLMFAPWGSPWEVRGKIIKATGSISVAYWVCYSLALLWKANTHSVHFANTIGNSEQISGFYLVDNGYNELLLIYLGFTLCGGGGRA